MDISTNVCTADSCESHTCIKSRGFVEKTLIFSGVRGLVIISVDFRSRLNLHSNLTQTHQ